MQKTTRIALLTAAALALPIAAQAQEGQPAPQPSPVQPAPASPQAEAQQIQQRLGQLQQTAMQDSAVKAASEAFAAYLQGAMERIDPQAKPKSERSEALRAEVEAARAASDNAKLNQLAAEATELQNYFTALQQQALQQPDVQEQRGVFVTALFTKMNELDPTTEQMVARLQELQNGGGQ